MRDAFIKTLEEQAASDRDIVVLTADLGFSVFENFQKMFPDRFFNVGISEQNMMGLAAGLSLGGKKVFVYSMIPFVTFRCLEQVRNDICYHDLGVVIVGVGSGVSYGPAGFSHHATEDIGVLKSIPNITILAPSDPGEVRQLVRESCRYKHPIYMRLGKNRETIFNNRAEKIRIGQACYLRVGRDTALVTYGNILEEVMGAYEMLKKSGKKVSVVTVPTIKPLDEAFFRKLFKTHKHVFIVEEHSKVGGLGDSLYAFIAKSNSKKLMVEHIAIEDEFISKVGGSRHIRKSIGLDSISIYNRIIRALRKG